MNLRLVERIINALLYEGYILYPYRASAIKNRRRWSFGVVYPQDYSLAQGGAEASSMQTECLLRWDHRAELDVKIRFLHLMTREVGKSQIPLTDSQEIIGQDLHACGALEIDAPTPDAWQEAVEREVDAPGIDLNEIVAEPRRIRFAFPAMRESTPLLNSGGQVVGAVARIQRLIEGAVEVTAERAGDGLFKVAARVMNLTPLEAAG
ncbi:MAG: hypothetical protein J2P52_13815, partial [Blastocatellia bacterium]|nr:hypothetical protein [Blastocatellia bacterium]